MKTILQFLKRKYRKLRYGTELTEEDYRGQVEQYIDELARIDGNPSAKVIKKELMER